MYSNEFSNEPDLVHVPRTKIKLTVAQLIEQHQQQQQQQLQQQQQGQHEQPNTPNRTQRRNSPSKQEPSITENEKKTGATLRAWKESKAIVRTNYDSTNWSYYLFLAIFLIVLLILIITLVITRSPKS